MDKELETYVELTMTSQKYRNGIFGSMLDRLATAIAFYRSGVDNRGVYHARKGAYWMDDYLESYVDQAMSAQVLRNGIFRSSPLTWVKGLFSKR